MNKNNLFSTFLLITIALLSFSCDSGSKKKDQSSQSKKDQPLNVLFIAVDDLRPELGCYGKSHIHSPNIDQLAKKGVKFEKAYCQVPVCGASRASLLSGLKPTRDRFVNYKTWVDKDAPGVTTLPQHFKQNGYLTYSLGKIYHHKKDDLDAWSKKPWGHSSHMADSVWGHYLKKSNLKSAKANGRCVPYESYDTTDIGYPDGQTANKAIQYLRNLKDSTKPFFLGVGFLKPHLPFNAPEKYWNMYQRKNIELPENDTKPEKAPDEAIHNWAELRHYENVPEKGRLSDSLAKTLIHGYYASISYADAQIGKVLKALKETGQRENTIIILWGDHGYQLREHGLWCKHSLFELALNTPLIVSGPEIPENKTAKSVVEFLDIYPSLCDLTGLKKPDHLDGQSFMRSLKNPSKIHQKHAYSRYYGGESIKKGNFRYTHWMNDSSGNIFARMLYDHKKDPEENLNVVDKKKYQQKVEMLQTILEEKDKLEF